MSRRLQPRRSAGRTARILIAFNLLAVCLPGFALAQQQRTDRPRDRTISTISDGTTVRFVADVSLSPAASEASGVELVADASGAPVPLSASSDFEAPPVPNASKPNAVAAPVFRPETNPRVSPELKTIPRSLRSEKSAEREAYRYASPVSPGPSADQSSPEPRAMAVDASQPQVKPLPIPPESMAPARPALLPKDKQHALIANITEPEAEMNLELHRSKLIRTKTPVSRFSITQPDTLDIVQYTPTEFELIPLRTGETTLTLWFGDESLRYLVRVIDTAVTDRTAVEYGDLQKKINEMFPDSMVQLIPIADKLIVRGQARDSAEAAQILSVLSGQAVNQAGSQLGPGSFINLGSAARPNPGSRDLPASNLVSLLEVPGEQQVMLKVRVAELSRTALRQMGWELRVTTGDFNLQSLLGVSNVFSAVLSTEDVYLALRALSTNGYSKILAEPNLVTLNGQAASFIAGGEFAVPTVVGVEGVSAVSTQFRGFGTQLTFTPTIVDKDRIRLAVAPSFSTINQANTVDGIPGLDTRAVITTVDLREGQWLAIAGLLQDRQEGTNVRVPFFGDIPVLGTLFSRRKVKRDETELVVLVSPELIHPMDAQETPLILPGMELTEPTDCDFFLANASEGKANCDHRSTAWPTQQARVLDAAKEAKRQANYQRSEKYYVTGPHGLSR